MKPSCINKSIDHITPRRGVLTIYVGLVVGVCTFRILHSHFSIFPPRPNDQLGPGGILLILLVSVDHV